MSESSVQSRTFYCSGCYCARCTACHCGLRAVIRVSKTPENWGKQFYGCVNYNRGGCNSFIWLDEVVNGVNGCGFEALKIEKNILNSELDDLKVFNKDLRNELKALKAELKLLKQENWSLKMKYKKMWKTVIGFSMFVAILIALFMKSSPLMVMMLT